MITRSWDYKVRTAVMRLHNFYRRAPWAFLGERDAECRLYMELARFFSMPRVASVQASEESSRVPKANFRKLRPKSIVLHADLPTRRTKGSHQRPDLALIAPEHIKLLAWNRKKGKGLQVGNYHYVDPSKAVGIELKFAISRGKVRGWMIRNAVNDIKKLLHYKRGWFIFMDQGGSFLNRKAWHDFFSNAARRANGGRLPRSITAYYLAANRNTPIRAGK